MDSFAHEDEKLWDELNHEHSREIEQHHYDRHRRNSNNNNHTTANRFMNHNNHHTNNGLLQQWKQQYTTHQPRVLELVDKVKETTTDVATAVLGNVLSSRQQHTTTTAAASCKTKPPKTRYRYGVVRNNSNDWSSQNNWYESLLSSSHNNDHNHREEEYINNNSSSNDNNINENDNDNNNNNNFIFLQPFRLLPRQDGWNAVSNLDLYFSSLYQYFYHRGLWPIVTKGIVELVTLFFTLWLSVVLFVYIDWNALLTCTDEHTCRHHLSDYIIQQPLSSTTSTTNDDDDTTTHNYSKQYVLIVYVYVVIFSCYGIFTMWSFYHTIQSALRSKFIMEEKLGISDRKLYGGSIDWDRDIVQKLIRLQQFGDYRIIIYDTQNNNNNAAAAPNNNNSDNNDNPMDALMIAQRIMRKENFLIALFNRKDLLDFSLPIPFLSHVDFFCKSLEWSLYFCVLNFMFNHKYQIRPAFYLDPESLKRRFIVCGAFHAVFMPFLLIFLTFHFILQNVYDWKSTKNYFGPRDWSMHSYWLMREFNELPHNYETRIQPSYSLANKYLSLFGSKEIVVALGRILVFVSSSLGFVLFLFAAINDSILLHVKINDWNLLWYGGWLGGIYSTGKAMLPKEQQEPSSQQSSKTGARNNIFGQMDDALYEVSTHTHFYPEIWHKRGWDNKTRKSFSRMFLSKTQLFLLEIVSVILSPIILCVSLPKCAESICEFVLAVRYEAPGTGDICGYSTFDFEKFTDERWEGRTIFSSNGNNNNNVYDGGGGGGDNDNNNIVVESNNNGRNGKAGIVSTMEEGNMEQQQPQQEEQEQQREQPAFYVEGSLSESILKTRNVAYSTQNNPKPKARHGKMEKSFFSFKAAHPSWKCSESGQHLVDRVEEFQRNEEAAALSRERQLHVEAAARQLETLMQLEQLQKQQQQQQRKQQESLTPGLQVIDEEYIPKLTPATTTITKKKAIQTTIDETTAADAGAGIVVPPPTRREAQPASTEGRDNGRGSSFVLPPGMRTGLPKTTPPTLLHNNKNTTIENQNLSTTAATRSLTNNVPPPSSTLQYYQSNSNSNKNKSNNNHSARNDDIKNNEISSAGLSTELRRILNMSAILDLEASVTGAGATMSGLNNRSTSILSGGMNAGAAGLQQQQFHQNRPERIAERQYLWLERYHAHIATERQEEEAALRKSKILSQKSQNKARAHHHHPHHHHHQQQQIMQSSHHGNAQAHTQAWTHRPTNAQTQTQTQSQMNSYTHSQSQVHTQAQQYDAHTQHVNTETQTQMHSGTQQHAQVHTRAHMQGQTPSHLEGSGGVIPSGMGHLPQGQSQSQTQRQPEGHQQVFQRSQLQHHTQAHGRTQHDAHTQNLNTESNTHSQLGTQQQAQVPTQAQMHIMPTHMQGHAHTHLEQSAPVIPLGMGHLAQAQPQLQTQSQPVRHQQGLQQSQLQQQEPRPQLQTSPVPTPAATMPQKLHPALPEMLSSQLLASPAPSSLSIPSAKLTPPPLAQPQVSDMVHAALPPIPHQYEDRHQYHHYHHRQQQQPPTQQTGSVTSTFSSRNPSSTNNNDNTEDLNPFV